MKAIKRGNEINQHQLITLVLLVIPGIKFLVLPSVMAEVAGRDSWIVMAAMFAVDFVCFFAIMSAFVLNKNHLSFIEILESMISKIGAKIVLAFYAVFYFLRIALTYVGVMDMLSTTFSMNTSWIGFMIPVLLVIGYNVIKGFRNIARVTEALVLFFVIAALAIITISALNSELENLKPFLAKGVKPIFEGMKRTRFWFGDCVFFIFLLGKFTAKKKLFLHSSLAFWVGAIFMLVFTAVFVAMYGELAQYNDNALAKISGLSIKVSAKGRFDWLLLIVWLSEVIIKTAIFLYVAAASVQEIIGVKNNKVKLIVLSVISLLILILPLFIDFRSFRLKYLVDGIGGWLVLLPVYIVPLASPLLTWLANKKKEKQQAPDGIVDPQQSLQSDESEAAQSQQAQEVANEI